MIKRLTASRTFRYLVTILVIALFAIYLATNFDKFRPLAHINSWFLILIGIGNIVFLVTSGLLTKYLLKPFSRELPLLEATYIALITSVGNFFAPAGTGLAIRAYYLKKKHKVPYSDYISILAGNYLIVFLVNSLFGLLALLALKSRGGSHYGVLVLIFALLFITSLALSFNKIKIEAASNIQVRWIKAIVKLAVKLSEGWQRILDYGNLKSQLALLTTLNLFISVAIFWLIISSLHLKASLGALLLFSVISMLSLFINITPANLGVKEALYIFSSGALGFSTTQIILIAIIDRGVSFMIMFISYIALRFKGSSFNKLSTTTE